MLSSMSLAGTVIPTIFFSPYLRFIVVLLVSVYCYHLVLCSSDGPVFSTPRKEIKKVVKKANVLDKKKTASQMKSAAQEVPESGPPLSEGQLKEHVDEAVVAATKAYVSRLPGG